MKYEEAALGLPKDWDGDKDLNESFQESALEGSRSRGASPGAEPALATSSDPRRRVQALGARLERLDAANVGALLAAGCAGEGARLAAALDAARAHAAALAARRARLQPPAAPAPHRAAAPDDNARRLLAELADLYEWLDAPPLQDLDRLPEISLTSAGGRERALAACGALQHALSREGTAPPAHRRLAAVRERVRRLTRARDQLAAAVARHVNNLLIHLGNEAAASPAAPVPPAASPVAPVPRHHADLLPLAPLMGHLKEMDERAFEALGKLYTDTWAAAHARSVRAACDAARTAPAAPDAPLDRVLALVETLCSQEQEFCTAFFHLEAGGEARRYMRALFPALESALLALAQHAERQDRYGAFRVLAAVGRRVLGAEGGGAEDAAWARAALAGVAVAAKRQADRCVAERAAALDEAARAAAKRPRAGLLPFLRDFEELSAECERIFAGGRRADLERWYCSLATAMLAAVARAQHPRTPRPVLQLENYHALGGALATLRVPALDAARRECRARYADALRAYVTQYFGRPLEKLTLFFEGVAEAVAGGVREDEVCYRAAFSKHELRRVLALYPAQEVRKSLHRLYRTVEKHLSEESGLLQVVWRAMQEEFIAQHRALQARIAACYPAAGLALPLTTQHILDAFSDIAREH